MQSTFIRFLTQDDRVRGSYELATRARCSSLPGEIYQVPLDALRLLDDQHIAYRRATDAEVANASTASKSSAQAPRSWRG